MNKYDALMEDEDSDKITTSKEYTLSTAEINDKYISLFEDGTFFSFMEQSLNDIDGETVDVADVKPEGDETPEEDVIEKDDNGKAYLKNGELIPNNEYTINGTTYKTDDKGRIVSFDSKPTYNEEGNRSLKEQKEVGGEERKEDDDGGHLVAKILGGAEGMENLVPMRRTINRGDYKKMENEIATACKNNQEVSLQGKIEYDGDSNRPSRISVEYQIDDKKTSVEFDNEECSTELLDTLQDKISEDDYNNLCDEIQDMKSDNCEVSVTSVKTEYDKDGNETKVTVGILNESTGEKSYKVYCQNQEG